jgi:hypothetical protein
MYALICDEHRLEEPLKKVISVHKGRHAAEVALEKRRSRLGRKIGNCSTRIVWVEKDVAPGVLLSPAEFDNWRPGETIPEGELHSDCD